MNKIFGWVLGYILLALMLIGAPLPALAQASNSYTLLSNATASGPSLFILTGGNFYVKAKATAFNSATFTLTETINGITTTFTPITTNTTGQGICVGIGTSAVVQMVVSGGTPSGAFATLEAVGPGGCSTANAGTVNFVSQFGAVADAVCDPTGVVPCTGTDNTTALNAYYTWVCTQPTLRGNHVFQRPQLFMAGSFLFSGSINSITCPGVGIYMAIGTTAVLHNTTPLMSLGTFTTSPTNSGNPSYYPGVANVWYATNVNCFDDIHVGLEKARTATCIQDNGAGTGMVRNLQCMGLKYCFNGPYGAQLDDFDYVQSQYNDHGVYLGPGSNQVTINEFHCGGPTYICLQLEGVPQVVINNPDFSGCGRFGLINHDGACVNIHSDLTTTLQGIPVCITTPAQTTPCGNYAMQLNITINEGWFETGNGGGGLVTDIILFDGTQTADAIRGLTLNNPYIVGGNGGAANSTTAVFIGGTIGGIAPRSIFLNGAINGPGPYQASWFAGVRVLYRDLGINNNGTLAPLQQSGDVNPLIDATSYAPATGTCPTVGYYPLGTITKNNGAVVATGKIQWGCVRITDGTKTQSNTLGTDWSLIFGTTTDARDTYRLFADADPLHLRGAA